MSSKQGLRGRQVSPVAPWARQRRRVHGCEGGRHLHGCLGVVRCGWCGWCCGWWFGWGLPGQTRVAPAGYSRRWMGGGWGLVVRGCSRAISIRLRDEKANSNLKMYARRRVRCSEESVPVWLSACSKLHGSQAWSGRVRGSSCPMNPGNDQRPRPATALREGECLLGDGEGWRGRERLGCGGYSQSGCRPAPATMQLRFSPPGLSFTRCRPAPHHQESANGTASGFAAAGEEQAGCPRVFAVHSARAIGVPAAPGAALQSHGAD